MDILMDTRAPSALGTPQFLNQQFEWCLGLLHVEYGR
jgi:hypothetical protein